MNIRNGQEATASLALGSVGNFKRGDFTTSANPATVESSVKGAAAINADFLKKSRRENLAIVDLLR